MSVRPVIRWILKQIFNVWGRSVVLPGVRTAKLDPHPLLSWNVSWSLHEAQETESTGTVERNGECSLIENLTKDKGGRTGLTCWHAKRTGPVARPSLRSAAEGFPKWLAPDVKSKTSSTNFRTQMTNVQYQCSSSWLGEQTLNQHNIC